MPKSFKELREASGLSASELARLAEEAGASRQLVYKLESGVQPMSPKWAKVFAPHLGVSWPVLMGIEGVSVGMPQAAQRQRVVPGLPEYTPGDLPGVPEIDLVGGLGSGGEAVAEAFTAGETDIISGDRVKDFWVLPPSYIAGEMGMKLANVRIFEVRGDSMEPTLQSTDRVMVNLADRVPSPEGLFAFFDGYGVSVKRLEIIPRSDPPSILAIADNPKHTQRTYAFDEVNIIGRVVWVARRM